ncbi:putative J domain-containing protein [Seiridium unicorne]|uniref:J domain-containing protein n=1 Tax=Seiridium unicorne TaxID=138068 RepID=A0ABR2VDE3_9PEZI
MGNEQSSNRGSTTQSDAPKKADYYDLLGVDRQATDDEIKKAYRRKALELHPDRNYGDTENATRKFAEVQAAYEVLSDAQERAWYDSHRDAILRGDDPNETEGTAEYYNVRMTTSSELFTLIGRFNSTVPFTDAPTGFFGILQETFDSLAQQEIAACEWDDQPIVDYPSFGSARDDYDSVAKSFYSVWSNFGTRKSFAWEDKWRLSDAPDRRVRRLMEKENRQIREEAKREFNDAVRSLVAFVRKRDPRYVPNTQSEAERQKILRDSAQQQAARARAANQKAMEEYVVPDWAQSRGDDHGLEGEFSETEDESEVEVLECVVCNKTFKTEKQYEAHEKSKKHVKAVQQLKRQMKKENAGLDLDGESASASPAAALSEDDELEADPLDEDSVPATRSKTETEGAETLDPNAPSASSEGESDDDEYAPRSAVEERLSSNPLKVEMVDDIDSIAGEAEDLSLNEAASAKKVGKAKAKRDRRAAKQAELEQQGASQKCAVCNENFDSKTKLFSHLKSTGHAAPVGSVKPAGKATKSSKKKR